MIFLEVNIDRAEFIRSWPGRSNWRVRPCPSSRLPPSRHLGGNVRQKMFRKIRILTLNTIGIWSVPGISGKVSKTPTTVMVTNSDGCDWNLKTLCSDLGGILCTRTDGYEIYPRFASECWDRAKMPAGWSQRQLFCSVIEVKVRCCAKIIIICDFARKLAIGVMWWYWGLYKIYVNIHFG